MPYLRVKERTDHYRNTKRPDIWKLHVWQIKPPSISQNYDAVRLKSLKHKDHAGENLQLQKQK